MFKNFTVNRKLLKRLDIGIIFTVLLISLFGVVNIYSATHNLYGDYYLKIQLFWIFAGLIVMYIALAVDYAKIGAYSIFIYGFFVLILAYTDKWGVVRGGARAWIGIGSIGIQPSEFMKIATILIIAKKIDDMEGDVNNPKNFFKLVLYILIPTILIIIQPDMGITMVMFFIFLGVFYAAGLNLKVIIGGISSVAIVILLVLYTGLLPSYMQNRILSFLNPSDYATSTGYQAVQSVIGIGSGGIMGKGFLNGNYSSGGFIPEIHTDYIFSVVGEEWGFIGAMILLLLYFILIYKFIAVAKIAKDLLGRYICVGVISYFLFSILQNIGMTIGLMPVTGITLPLMSYGGSSMLSIYIGIGLILNVGMRSKKINF
ncbi:MAG: rod shape-determining protein RodA [Clostridiaceae bacterium]